MAAFWMMRWIGAASALQRMCAEKEIPMRVLLLLLILFSTLMLGGCEVIGDIFKAGVWVGVILVVLILAGVGFVVSKLRS
jgi:hypothetical protein